MLNLMYVSCFSALKYSIFDNNILKNFAQDLNTLNSKKCEIFAEYLLPPKCHIQHIMCWEGKTEKKENNYAVQLGRLLRVTAKDFLDS